VSVYASLKVIEPASAKPMFAETVVAPPGKSTGKMTADDCVGTALSSQLVAVL
jgi:hypothetical protein